MKRKLIALIMILMVYIPVFANTSSMAVGGPEDAGPSFVDVSFTYDPRTMFRESFGFTNESTLHWEEMDGDLADVGLTLITENRGDEFRGVGNVNFYWKTRTPDGISAKIYIASPMVDVSGAKRPDLNLKITFKSIINDLSYLNNTIDSLYGIENAMDIYYAKADPSIPVVMDLVPITIQTDYVKVGSGDAVYKSSIGIIVESI